MQLRRQRARSNTDAKQKAVDPTGYSQRSKQAQDRMQTASLASSLHLPEASSAPCVVPPAAALLWLRVLLPLATGSGYRGRVSWCHPPATVAGAQRLGRAGGDTD